MFLRLLTILTIGFLAACSGGNEADSTAQGSKVPGVDLDRKIIRIGALNGESGPAAVIGKPYALGKRMLVQKVNEGNSGILPDGWKIELVERDHGYNPQRSVQMFNEIREDVLFIATSFGTPNTLPLRPMLQRHKLVAYPVSLSSKMAEFTYTPPIAPSYVVEAQRAMDWAVESAGGADKVKAGIIYQQDDYGKDGYDGWKKAAAFHGVEIVKEETYAPGQADYTAAISALKQAGATHVLLTTLPSATGPILGAAAQLDYSPTWIGNLPSWIDRFFDPNVIPAKVFDNYYQVGGFTYWGEANPGMDDFLKFYEKYGKDKHPPDGYIMLSYFQGLFSLEVLRRAIEANELTREGYLKAMQSVTNYDLNGVLNYKIDLSKVPYVAGVETRVMKPDFANNSWQEVAPFAAPKSPH